LSTNTESTFPSRRKQGPPAPDATSYER